MLYLAANSIDTISIPGYRGALGLVACPGVRINKMTYRWQTQLRLYFDLQRIRRWGAHGVVTLLEEQELKRMGLQRLPRLIKGANLWWKYLPIEDRAAPDDWFEEEWESQGARLREQLLQGERIIIHCFAGLGRTGMIAARILVECGMDPKRAIATVRHTQPARIQTRAQYHFVRNLKQPMKQG